MAKTSDETKVSFSTHSVKHGLKVIAKAALILKKFENQITLLYIHEFVSIILA